MEFTLNQTWPTFYDYIPVYNISIQYTNPFKRYRTETKSVMYRTDGCTDSGDTICPPIENGGGIKNLLMKLHLGFFYPCIRLHSHYILNQDQLDTDQVDQASNCVHIRTNLMQIKMICIRLHSHLIHIKLHLHYPDQVEADQIYVAAT